MKVVIVISIVTVVLFIALVTWSLCAAAGRYDNDDEEQMKYLKEMRKKDNDVPM